MPSTSVRMWNAFAAIVVLGLVFSTVFQESFDRSMKYSTPPGVPYDFPHYYIAARQARLKPPANLLYYLPPDHTLRSILELRIDSTTPYGSALNGSRERFVSEPFIAPPFTALLLEPLAFLPWRAAYFVWQVLCAFMMAAAFYWALHLSSGNPPALLVAAVGVAIAFLFLPFKWCLMLGNIDVLVLLLWVLGVFSLSRGRVLPSALFFALGTAIKISPIYAVPLLALRRQWRWLAAYGVSMAALMIISLWGMGWQNHLVWARQVSPALACGVMTLGNRSLPGFVLALGSNRDLSTFLPAPQAICTLNKALSAVCYGAFLAWCWRQRRDAKGLTAELTLLPLIVLLISPLSWPQYWVLAVLPLTYLWARSREPAAGHSALNLILLSGSTLIFSNSIPLSRWKSFFGSSYDLWSMGIWLMATLALLWVGVRMYDA